MRLRPATLSDHPHIAALTAELATGDPPPTFERFRTLCPGITIAEPDDQPGVVLGYLLADELDGLGYIRHLISAPIARRTGVGRTLMLDYAAKLRAKGVGAWCLNVKPENTPAVQLYRSLGMRREYDSWSVAVPWRLGRGDLGVRVRPMRVEETAAFEQRFFVAPGLLTLHIGLDRKRLLVAERDAADASIPVGFASYDLDFGGAFPIAAADLPTLTTLIDACAAAVAADKSRPPPPDLKMVIERDAALAEALLAAGGTLRLAFTHMKGPVPPVEPG